MKRLLIALLILGLGAGIYVYNLYNKEHTNIEETDASIRISSTALFNEYDINFDIAQKELTDQVIEVTGPLREIDLSNPEEPQIVLDCENPDGSVRCGFKPSEKESVLKYKDSSTITLKGECKGFLDTDELDLLLEKEVILSNCIILE